MYLIYYSPALSTQKIARFIGKSISKNIKEYDITLNFESKPEFDSSDFVLFAVPVFAGRVPAQASEAITQFKGNNTPAIVVCIYGNRDYEDALLELRNITQSQGFVPIAGGAFIARHSIFPNMAPGRPDEKDRIKILKFAQQSKESYNEYIQHKPSNYLKVKGNFPYRNASAIPLFPKGDNKCNRCGTCVKLCPVGAIPEHNPTETNHALCISCARCTSICPKKSRTFGGDLYESVKMKFEENLAGIRKEPETFFLD